MLSATVTVMVPSYNYAEYLAEAVESAASQRHSDVVIVENGSTDGSPEIARELADRFDNVRLVEYADNRGIMTSFNRCREQVRGEYVALLCADDVLTPGSLERSVAFLDAHPGVGLVYGRVASFSSVDRLPRELLADKPGTPVIHPGDAWAERICTTGSNPILTPEVVMRSSAYLSAGPYDDRTPYTSDMVVWLGVASVSDVAYLPTPVQALFRMHDANVGKGYPHASARELSQRWAAFEVFFERLGDDSRRAAWERAARRRLGRLSRYSATRAFARADAAAVEALLALADELCPNETVVDRVGWATRRQLGPALTRVFPPMLVRPAVNRVSIARHQRRCARFGLA